MQKNKKQLIILVSVLASLGLIVYIFFFSPIFRVDEIEVIGNVMMKDEEVCETLGVSVGDNELWLMLKDIFVNSQTVENLDARIQKADIFYQNGNKMIIKVVETTLVGYLYFQGTYLWLDTTGVAIHSGSPDPQNGLIVPMLEGITVSDFNVGGAISESARSRLSIINEIVSALKKYDLEDDCDVINVRDLDGLTLKVGTLTVSLGKKDDISEKIQILNALLKEQPDVSGLLHLEDLEGQIYLESN